MSIHAKLRRLSGQDSKRRPDFVKVSGAARGHGGPPRPRLIRDAAPMMQSPFTQPLAAPDYCMRSRHNDSLGSPGRWRSLAALCAVLLAVTPGTALAQREINLQPPVTPIAAQIYDLHTYIMWICVVIFVGVFAVMFYSIFAHRKSKGHQAAQFHENTLVEIVWTVIPFLILLLMAIPATKTILAMKDTSVSDMTIKVTGYQWKWGYDYLDDGISFVSNLATPYAQIYGQEPKGEHYLLDVDQPMVVPTDKRVRVLITAGDVIHSWWVPAFGVKQDAIPGFVRDSWFKVEKPGIYRGQCAELCGKEHGFMPIVVEAKSPADYAKWLDGQKKKAAALDDDPNKVWELKDLIARGEKVYAANCVACHQASGKGVPGAFPALDGSKLVVGPKNAQIKIVLDGVTKDGQPTAMVAWKNTLSDADIAAVLTYTRNSWGNHTGETIQPAEVKVAKQ
jgi:cytochrome c oxidase subunit II